MMRRLIFVSVIAILIYASFVAAMAEPLPSSSRTLSLNSGWLLQSSGKVKSEGASISTAQYRPQGWYSVNLPSTVVRALVRDKVYPEPYFGMNLRKLPGVTYPIGENFSNLAMAADSPFAVSWWYRKTFVLPAS